MTPESFLKRLASLKTWARGGVRAPHKPLLLLLALGHLGQGHPRMRFYREIELELKELLQRFGPPGTKPTPVYPFYRLYRQERLWAVEGLQACHRTGRGDDLKAAALRQSNVKGGLPAEIHQLLVSQPALFLQAVACLLECYFPARLHRQLLKAVGLRALLEPDIRNPGRRKIRPRRDPDFRDSVIRAYGYRCAICAYDIRMGEQLMGLEAAHIRWHAYSGPDEISNGLALCLIHRQAFGMGSISLSDDFALMISPHLRGQNEAWDYWFSRFRARSIRLPKHADHAPDPGYLQWHRRWVCGFPQE